MRPAIVVLLFLSCFHSAPPRGPFPAPNTDGERMAIRVDTWCVSSLHPGWSGVVSPSKSGSGVIVSGRVALTAAHVVSCAAGQLPLALVTTTAGKEHPARIARVNYDVDLARLELDAIDPAFDAPRATVGAAQKFNTRIAPVSVGDAVCSATANPERRVQCGSVTEPLEFGVAFRDSGISIPGNSGSGVYDVDGNLVGIVTHLYTPQLGGGRRCVAVSRFADWVK